MTKLDKKGGEVLTCRPEIDLNNICPPIWLAPAGIWKLRFQWCFPPFCDCRHVLGCLCGAIYVKQSAFFRDGFLVWCRFRVPTWLAFSKNWRTGCLSHQGSVHAWTRGSAFPTVTAPYWEIRSSLHGSLCLCFLTQLLFVLFALCTLMLKHIPSPKAPPTNLGVVFSSLTLGTHNKNTRLGSTLCLESDRWEWQY